MLTVCLANPLICGMFLVTPGKFIFLLLAELTNLEVLLYVGVVVVVFFFSFFRLSSKSCSAIFSHFAPT